MQDTRMEVPKECTSHIFKSFTDANTNKHLINGTQVTFHTTIEFIKNKQEMADVEGTMKHREIVHLSDDNEIEFTYYKNN